MEVNQIQTGPCHPRAVKTSTQLSARRAAIWDGEERKIRRLQGQITDSSEGYTEPESSHVPRGKEHSPYTDRMDEGMRKTGDTDDTRVVVVGYGWPTLPAKSREAG